jgi:hypothetical protein
MRLETTWSNLELYNVIVDQIPDLEGHNKLFNLT